ncbi:acyltransferase [Leptospira gomenensis]|uniref:Acyltransferase n=1 Tax=Leptospira gomenensis TaxID=2484974 RepID=A0A5F1YFS8_9LEPT|nr:acyltransferase [Leptospira gomenensis]TGK38390.1 acyltransferase [Leptospira gomenensis]TGK39332.1 acyltransferase [Leptospira gomenensis]TGK52204.1 acyltransferase [Leptospira gomenensis]TGK62942.1 acyltransferase [Leptospira gomenensis]
MNPNLSLFIDLFGLCIIFFLCIYSKIPFKILCEIPPKSENPGRSSTVDFIRGLAITGIVFIHVNSYYQFFGPTENVSAFTLAISNVSRFSVPAFILSSGIFLKPAPFKDYWKSKILSLIVPYFFVSLFAAYVKLGALPAVAEFLTGFLLGTWCAPYYFVPLLFLFYLIYPALQKIKNRLKSNAGIFTFLGTALLLNFLSNHVFLLISDPLSKTLEPISPTGFIFFFVFGMLTGSWFRNGSGFLSISYESSPPLPYPFRKLLFLGTVLYLTAVFLAGISWKFDSSNHLLFYPTGMFLLLFLWAESFAKNRRHSKLLSGFAFIGKNSMGIFLLHPLLIHWMHAWNPFEYGAVVAWLAVPVVAILNVILPLCVWIGIGKIFELIRLRSTERS